MKKLLFIISLLLTTKAYCKLDTLNSDSKITDVTVFFSGAQVSREVKLNLKPGKHLLFFDRLPEELNPQSIQVKGMDGLQILSVKHQLNYKDQGRKSDKEQAIHDKIEQQKVDMKSVGDDIGVLDIEERLLLENSKIVQSQEGTSVQQLSEVASFYRERISEIRKKKLKLKVKLKDHQEELEDFYKELNKILVFNRQTYSQIMISVNCERSITKPINFSYFISSAGWTPLYDFRVQDVASPLSIVYNANVYQSSGEDWKNVDIILSSSDPTRSGNKPELKKFILGKAQPKTMNIKAGGASALTGRVFDSESGEALPFCNVTVYKGNRQIAGTTTDFNGMYTIKPIPQGYYVLKVSYVGFQTAQVDGLNLRADEMLIKDVAMKQGIELNSVEIVEYSKPLFEKDQTTTGHTVTREEIQRMAVRSNSRTNVRGNRVGSSVTFIDGVKVIGSTIQPSEINLISNSIKQGISDFEYQIQIPYSIPSDGEDYNLKIKEVKLDVEYIYYTVPKLDPDAFLTAKLIDWNELNLLSGKTSVYYEGTFKSESYLDVERASDTLNISLGRDKGIFVKRELDEKMTEKKKFGRNVKETVGWEITVKNNKRAPIKIIVEDQYPVSDRDAVEVELQETAEAKIDKEEAKLSWELELKPQEKKKIKFGFEVEYPRYNSFSGY